jgi:hypothetical protein
LQAGHPYIDGFLGAVNCPFAQNRQPTGVMHLDYRAFHETTSWCNTLTLQSSAEGCQA